MVIDVVAFVDIAYDTDPWFVLEEPIDESIQIGVPEVVVEHSDGDIQVLILALLVSTVLGTRVGIRPYRHPG